MTTTVPTLSDRLDAGQLRQLQDEIPNVRLLDVRTGGEFETAHIPGSYNVPLDSLDEHVGKLANVECPVVLVCQTGGRATQAQSKLASAGKSSVYILDGGINAWQANNGELATGEVDRWAMDRQVRLVAGSFVMAGVAASTVVPGVKWLAGAVGAGLTYSAASNTCAMATVLSKLPYNQADACDIESVLAELNGPATAS